MRKIGRREGALLMVVLLLAGWGHMSAGAVQQGGTDRATVFFTHDTHSHLLPVAWEGGGEYGGYTRLATLLNRERKAARCGADGGWRRLFHGDALPNHLYHPCC